MAELGTLYSVFIRLQLLPLWFPDSQRWRFSKDTYKHSILSQSIVFLQTPELPGVFILDLGMSLIMEMLFLTFSEPLRLA